VEKPSAAVGARRLPSAPAELRAVSVAFVLAAAGLALTRAGANEGPRLHVVGAVWILAALWAAAEALPVHVELRREAVSFSLTTIPLLVGLYTLGAGALVAARLVGSAVALIGHRRQRPFKLAVNLSVIWLETAVALTVFRIVAPTHGAGVGTWPAAVAATLAGAVACSLSLAAAISLYQRRWEAPLAATMLAVLVDSLVETSLGVVALTLLVDQPVSLLPFGVVAALTLASYRLYAASRAERNHLQQLYDFAGLMNHAVLDGQVTATLITQVAELMHAESACILLTESDGTLLRVTADGDAGLQTGHGGPIVRSIHADVHALGAPTFLSSAQASAVAATDGPAAERAAREALAAPLVGSSGPLGTLVVADRSGRARRFQPSDLRRLAALAGHASVALENNNRLVETLRLKADENEYQSLHDSLTGLPNRKLFFDRLAEAIAAGDQVAVLLLDLDRFKEVNDTLGHHSGDLLLQHVATELRHAVRTTDVVARLGGDEFAVLLSAMNDEETARSIAGSVVQLFDRPFPIQDILIDVGVSVGIAMSPRDGNDPATVMQRADVAMYTAKRDQTGVETYSVGRDQNSPERLRFVGELRRAVNGRELEVYYQPQIDLFTAEVIGVEALARWRHPTRGMIPSDEFIAMAEQTGLIHTLTEFVLETALDQTKTWQRAGWDLRLSVNLSARNLLQRSLVEMVAAMLRKHDVPADRVCFEVTESALMTDTRVATETLVKMAKLGLTVGIDDFGMGHSSLAYIKHLPVGELKVDKSFVRSMVEDRRADAIVQMILQLGRSLDISVMAEGVEDAPTRDRLIALGCPAGQGYLFGRPMPAEDMTAWLERQAGDPACPVYPLDQARRKTATSA
jgi:diguanylate cyclase (GGDEF)-like protein